MARELDEFPKATRRSKYKWDQWLNGKPWLLRQGEDFQTSSESFRAVASRAAAAEGKRLRTRLTSDDDGTKAIVIQAYDD